MLCSSIGTQTFLVRLKINQERLKGNSLLRMEMQTITELNTERSSRLFEAANAVIPGGVNSPVRAFRAVGGDPLFIKKAIGAYIFDEDDNKYFELINSWGPMVLGHAHPVVVEAVQRAAGGSFSYGAPTEAEVKMANLIVEMVRSVEKVRLVNSGTEATMSAIRLARGFTGREKMIKFEGCYHGHGDSFLIAAGSGAATLGVPNSPGVTHGTAQDTLTASYNDLESVEVLFKAFPDEIAALIVEPVAGNMGLVEPAEGFLQGLRGLCTQYGALLVFDEVMTGFRLAPGGVQELMGVMPDLTTLGKIIGGGLPVGAYGGRAEVMDFVSPKGPVYQAGTLSGNPLAMAAGLATLGMLQANPEIYQQLRANGAKLAGIWRAQIEQLGLPCCVNQIGSMFTLFFSEGPVTNWTSAARCDTARFGKFFHAMLNQGVYMAPAQYESLFVSIAASQNDFDLFEEASYKALKVAFA